MIALIPARKGSTRVKDKNIRDLGGHPLMAYAIRSAIDSGLFEHVVVSSDSRDYLAIAKEYGAETIIRQFKYADDLSPDIDWVKQVFLPAEHNKYKECDSFSILRPTAPFRTAETIKRAHEWFQKMQPCDSIRAMELCKQHPYKMWRYEHDLTVEHHSDNRVVSFIGGIQSNNSPYQGLPRMLVQNASLEMAWTKILNEQDSISGNLVKPFLTSELEGFDINTAMDFTVAELLLKEGIVECQKI